MTPTPRYPRGNPLTESMPFTDRDGRPWLVYIEGLPTPRLYRRHRATLPARRLRFDSAGESRATTELPAGSPFLADARLQWLLDQAQPVPLSFPAAWQPLEMPDHVDRAIEWATRAREAGSAVLNACSRRWREGAGQRRALGEHAQRSLSGWLDTMLSLVGGVAASRRARWRGEGGNRPRGPR